MALRSSNPVFTRGARAQRGGPDVLTWPPSGHGGTPPSPEELARVYRQPSGLTIDDVVVHTLGLLGVALAGGVVGWLLEPGAPGVVFGAGIIAFVLSLVIGFTGRINPPLVLTFAVLAGIGAGGVSRVYEDLYSGIILQAMIGTGLIFVTMLLAYRSRRLRATPRMARVVGGVLMGVVLISLLDLGLRLTTGSHLPIINDATPLGILFSLAVLVFASLQFILDFDYIERAIEARAPRSEAWRASYGLLIGFLWVYLEMLRLLSKLRRF
jgi:uncharacterized YccA/Bax inhibitor family protein